MGKNTFRSRHCEERSDVAIQVSANLADIAKPGLPRRCAPRNDVQKKIIERTGYISNSFTMSLKKGEAQGFNNKY